LALEFNFGFKPDRLYFLLLLKVSLLEQIDDEYWHELADAGLSGTKIAAKTQVRHMLIGNMSP